MRLINAFLIFLMTFLGIAIALGLAAAEVSDTVMLSVAFGWALFSAWAITAIRGEA